jgi:RluA family pseudouridine synthase
MRWQLEHILKKSGGGILAEDDTLIVINKPAGLLVLPDRYDRSIINLSELLREVIEPLFVVHRIDRETSGVVLFAKTAEAHAFLNDAFESREVRKSYLAIVAGSQIPDAGAIDLPIGESEGKVRKMRIDSRRGKEARTEFRVVERYNGYALLDVRPHTGRTHQIRIHLAAKNLPIVADPLYGDGQPFFLSAIKRNYKTKGEEQPLLWRTALHAHSLSFTHPVTKEMMSIEAPLPKDMGAVVKALRKYCGENTAGSASLVDSQPEE